jgi:predicted ATPase
LTPPNFPPIDIDKAVAWCQGKTGKQLAPSQQAALRQALSSRVLIITGDPGVGKTTLVNATRLLLALNEAGKQPAMNLGLARVYLKHSDPMVAQRTWQHVLDEIVKLKSGPTQYRWQTASRDKAFDLICSRLLIETQAEHLLEVLKKGTVSTNAYLRKTHNFALDMNWLPATVIPRRQWPAIHFKEKRAITLPEHQRIVAAEVNTERKTLYQLCWAAARATSPPSKAKTLTGPTAR